MCCPLQVCWGSWWAWWARVWRHSSSSCCPPGTLHRSVACRMFAPHFSVCICLFPLTPRWATRPMGLLIDTNAQAASANVAAVRPKQRSGSSSQGRIPGVQAPVSRGLLADCEAHFHYLISLVRHTKTHEHKQSGLSKGVIIQVVNLISARVLRHVCSPFRNLYVCKPCKVCASCGACA